ARTPIRLLADSVDLDARWQLVHATHAEAEEIDAIADSGSGVVICPITEAYLGDGLFDAVRFREKGGRLAIGSDSNCRIDAFEELRLLEYGQRLREQRRARLATTAGLGAPLWLEAVAAGTTALQLPCQGVTPGAFADFLAFDETADALAGHDADSALDALIINGGRTDVSAVFVGGRRIVDNGRHSLQSRAHDEFHQVVRTLITA